MVVVQHCAIWHFDPWGSYSACARNWHHSDTVSKRNYYNYNYNTTTSFTTTVITAISSWNSQQIVARDFFFMLQHFSLQCYKRVFALKIFMERPMQGIPTATQAWCRLCSAKRQPAQQILGGRIFVVPPLKSRLQMHWPLKHVALVSVCRTSAVLTHNVCCCQSSAVTATLVHYLAQWRDMPCLPKCTLSSIHNGWITHEWTEIVRSLNFFVTLLWNFIVFPAWQLPKISVVTHTDYPHHVVQTIQTVSLYSGWLLKKLQQTCVGTYILLSLNPPPPHMGSMSISQHYCLSFLWNFTTLWPHN